MRQFYGVLIVSFKDGGREAITHPLDAEVVSIDSEGERDGITIPDVKDMGPPHALVLSGPDGINVRNESAQDGIWRTTNLSNESAEDGIWRNGGRRTVPPGAIVPLDQHAEVEIGPLVFQVRLAPGVSDAGVPVPHDDDPELLVHLSPSQLIATPGKAIPMVVTVTNKAATTREVTVQSEGLGQGWDKTPNDSLKLGLDSVTSPTRANVGQFQRTFVPPKYWAVKAGAYPFKVIARASSGDDAVTVPKGATLVVLPFVRYGANLRPEKRGAWWRGRYNLTLVNESNCPLRFTMALQNDEDAVRWNLLDERRTRLLRRDHLRRDREAVVTLEPGEGRGLELRVAPRPKRLLGPRHDYPFKLTVAPQLAEAGGPQLADQDDPNLAPTTIGGELRHRPPYLLLALLTLLAVVLVVWRFPQIPVTVAHRVALRPVATAATAAPPRLLRFTGTVMPAQPTPLAFGRDGQFQQIDPYIKNCPAPCRVARNQLLAQLQPDPAALQQAEAQLAAADAAHAQAEQQLDRDRDRAVQRLELAREAFRRLDRGGENDVFAAAQQVAREAQAASFVVTDTAEIQANMAKSQWLQAAAAVEEAQRQFTKADWEKRWVEANGTHPTELVKDAESGLMVNRPLNRFEQLAFVDTYSKTLRLRDDSYQVMTDTLRAWHLAQKQGDEAKTLATQKLVKANQDAARLKENCDTERISVTPADSERDSSWLQSCDNEALTAAYAAVADAERELAALGPQSTQATDQSRKAASEALQRAKEAGRAGKLAAPGDGYIALQPLEGGADIRANAPVGLFFTEPTYLVMAALSLEQLGELGTTTQVTLSQQLRPGSSYSGTLQLLPAPLGESGGPDLAQGRSARITFNREHGDDIQLYDTVAVTASISVAPRLPDQVWVPQAYVVSSPEGSYVFVRDGLLDYRIPVELGRKTETLVEVRSLADASAKVPESQESQKSQEGPWYDFLFDRTTSVPLRPDSTIVAP